MSGLTCSTCGGTTFTDRQILWAELVSECQLAPHEHAYVDRQQGTACTTCGANLRSIALAYAIRGVVGTSLTLREFVKTSEAGRLAVLEINEAGNLSPLLQQLPGHTLAAHPAIDMRTMPYPTDAFDLVVHSDTLEHIANPICAFGFRVPTGHSGPVRPSVSQYLPHRRDGLSRSREGLPKSYHGSANTGTDDYVVQTEFGADMWTYVLRAGFSAVSITAVEYPAALALSARKDA